MRSSQLLAAVLAMSSVSTAMSGAFDFDNIHGLGHVKHILMGRQDDNAKSSQAAQSSTPKATASASQTKDSDKDQSSSTKASGSAAASGSQGSKTTSGKASNHTSFDARVPAGGISMATPNALAGSQFYKVGDWVTFAWNYTSLSVTPSYIDILASCTANQATYTIAVNQSATETKVLWDTGSTPSGQPPFLTEKYTLIIYDAQSSISAAPEAGYLAPYSQLIFGMYTPQPYVSLGDFNCANCVKNAGFSQSERMTLQVLLFTSGTTIASLLYFAHNFGLW